MALDATVGGASSNSFVTRAEASAHFTDHPFGTTWLALTGAAQDTYLIYATMAVDSLCYDGQESGSTQALSFPMGGLTRNGQSDGVSVDSSTIPIKIKRATYEHAAYLAANGDVQQPKDQHVQGLTELTAGDITLKFAKDFDFMVVPSHILALIPKGWLCDEAEPEFYFAAV